MNHGIQPLDYDKIIAGNSRTQVHITNATKARISVYEKGKVLIKISEGPTMPIAKAIQTAVARNHREKPKQNGVLRVHFVEEMD